MRGLRKLSQLQVYEKQCEENIIILFINDTEIDSIKNNVKCIMYISQSSIFTKKKNKTNGEIWALEKNT